MRKSSQVIMGALTLGSVITGIQLGATAKSGEFLPSPVPTGEPTASPNPNDSASPTPQPTGNATKNPAPKPQSTITKTSKPIYYRYGVVQVSVVKRGSTITDVQLDQATATNGRSSAFSYLVQLAINAQGSNFDSSMMSGATFTTDAFTQALDSALSKF